MQERQVRTRIAPSPTGDPHVGTAYQALFNSVFARSRGGSFLLRIEDTDQTRSSPASEAAILDSLAWLGLSWNEGPDVGGPHAPYRQSERTGIYRDHVDELLRKDQAYRCFCTRERLAEVRSRQGATSGYDRHCRDLEPEAAKARAEDGESFVVRLKVPREGECVFEDLLRGTIRKDWASVDDQILLKADGFPTYHLANVVDDHLMEISHVLRGEEWLNSVPKHLQIYAGLGWVPPVFCHLPLLRNNDAQKTKLSKRKNPTSIRYYRRAGILPEALLNYLALMGWAMPDGREKFSVDEMVEGFDPSRISLGGPVFDGDKLRWLNGRYLREDYTPEGLQAVLEEWALNPRYVGRIVPLVQPRLETLADWGPLTAPFFSDGVTFDPDQLVVKGKTAGETMGLLQVVLWRLEELRDFRAPALENLFREEAEVHGIKLRDFNLPFYVALSGSKVWTPLYDSMEILGSDLVRTRLRRAIEAGGGIPKKKLKELEKQYRKRRAEGGDDTPPARLGEAGS
jgi:glutamyl-tRNA synthetase